MVIGLLVSAGGGYRSPGILSAEVCCVADIIRALGTALSSANDLF